MEPCPDNIGRPMAAALEALKSGSSLHKVRDKGFRGYRLYRRIYKVSLKHLILISSAKESTRPYHSRGQRCAPSYSQGQVIDLDDISEVRGGHGTDVFNRIVKVKAKGTTAVVDLAKYRFDCGTVADVSLDRCFSIIFKKGHKPLDLIAPDPATRNQWVNVLNHLILTMKSLDEQKEYDMYLKKQFRLADETKTGSLNLKECRSLVENLNVRMDSEELELRFKEANTARSTAGSEEVLDEEEFIKFYYSLLRKPEVDKIFLKYATKKPGKIEGGLSIRDGAARPRMTPEDLREFFAREQEVEVSPEECEKLIEVYEPSKDNDGSLCREGFTHFMMFSSWQELQDQARSKVAYQDMTKPLSHYNIASSHNTYLLGNQVTSESSVDAYIRALKMGCRCVEMDCWDGEHGEPIIYHGWTMTSKITFKDVIHDAILKYAFYASDYPLILSIENHCSLEYQDKMAKHLTQILGDKLYKNPVDESRTELPSPEELKFKILIKAKKLPAGFEETDELPPEDQDDDFDDDVDEKRKNKTKKISKKLSDLVNYVEAVHFPGFAEKGKFYHMSSFGEAKAFQYFQQHAEAQKFVLYNTRQISRIYPGAKRQDSSNFNPLPAWNSGCQIVALNYQTEDKANFLNRAKFSDNGGCGYVLKPDFLTRPDTAYSPVVRCRPTGEQKVMLTITIVSGQHLPKPDGKMDGGEIIDPYVKVRIRGHPGDKKNKARTHRVKNNGFNPVWTEAFDFAVNVPSLAFLDFRVKDHSKSGSDKTVAAFCCPLNTIQPGYRRVPLFNYAGIDLSPASLLIHIKLSKKP